MTGRWIIESQRAHWEAACSERDRGYHGRSDQRLAQQIDSLSWYEVRTALSAYLSQIIGARQPEQRSGGLLGSLVLYLDPFLARLQSCWLSSENPADHLVASERLGGTWLPHHDLPGMQVDPPTLVAGLDALSSVRDKQRAERPAQALVLRFGLVALGLLEDLAREGAFFALGLRSPFVVNLAAATGLEPTGEVWPIKSVRDCLLLLRDKTSSALVDVPPHYLAAGRYFSPTEWGALVNEGEWEAIDRLIPRLLPHHAEDLMVWRSILWAYRTRREVERLRWLIGRIGENSTIRRWARETLLGNLHDTGQPEQMLELWEEEAAAVLDAEPFDRLRTLEEVAWAACEARIAEPARREILLALQRALDQGEQQAQQKIGGSMDLAESAVALARLHASLGEVDPTLAWVERAQDLLKADGSHFKAGEFDLVRDHPRFKKVVPFKRRR